MTLAYTYPLLNVFWSMLFFFMWIVWLMMLFFVIMDIFRSHDIGGLAKAGWLLFTLVLPFLGVFVYLIARGGRMGQRESAAPDVEGTIARYGNGAASSPGDQLAQLASLHDSGTITDDEYAAGKAKILA